MSSSESNGNGLRNAWAAASVCSAIVLALAGAFGSSYVRDQTRTERRVEILEDDRVASSYARGRSDQRLEELQALAHAIRDALNRATEELDAKLQRELALADDTLRTEIRAVDARLLEAIRANRDERADRLAEIRSSLEKLDAARQALEARAWTRDEQLRFEERLERDNPRKPHP